MPLKKLMLVRWLVDETVGVVPTSTVQKGETVEVGAIAGVKWGSKFYQAEILQISSKWLVCYACGLFLASAASSPQGC